MYLDHLKLCIVCINRGRYVCCSECNVVSDECDEPILQLGMCAYGVSVGM